MLLLLEVSHFTDFWVVVVAAEAIFKARHASLPKQMLGTAAGRQAEAGPAGLEGDQATRP